MVSVKAHCGEEIRRLRLPEDNGGSFEELLERLRSVFDLPAVQPLRLKWQDEEADRVSFSSDAELLEAVRCVRDCGVTTLKVFVELADQPRPPGSFDACVQARRRTRDSCVAADGVRGDSRGSVDSSTAFLLRVADAAVSASCAGGQEGGVSARLCGQEEGVSARLCGQAGGVSARLCGQAGGVSARLCGQAGGVSARLCGQEGGVSARLCGQKEGVSVRLCGQEGGVSARLCGQEGGVSVRLGGQEGGVSTRCIGGKDKEVATCSGGREVGVSTCSGGEVGGVSARCAGQNEGVLARSVGEIECVLARSAPAGCVASVQSSRRHSDVEAEDRDFEIVAETEPRIARAVEHMTAMGFSDEGGWLTRLLLAKDGDICAVLDALRPVR